MTSDALLLFTVLAAMLVVAGVLGVGWRSRYMQVQRDCTALAAQAAADERSAQVAQGRIAALEAELVRLNGEDRVVRTQLAGVEARVGHEVQLRAEREEALRVAQRRCDELLQGQRELERAHAGVVAENRALRQGLEAQEQQRLVAEQHQKKEFEAVSARLLRERSEEFRTLSREQLESIIKPLQEALDSTRSALAETKGATARHSEILVSQISRIGQEAESLTRALKGDGKTLGTWGEQILDGILERSGLQLGVHYHRQVAARSDEGEQRFLDVVVELPQKRHLIIDSKASLSSYHAAANSSDQAEREEHLRRHVAAIREHVRGLGKKHYAQLQELSSPDFVLMFVPLEHAYMSALQCEPQLFMEALNQRVAIVTNTTLLATLHTVAHVWRLADQQRNAEEIARRGAILYDKFRSFVEDLEHVGRGILSARDRWQQTWNKLVQGNGNLVWQAESLRELGVKPKRALDAALSKAAQPVRDELEAEPYDTSTSLAAAGSDGEGNRHNKGD